MADVPRPDLTEERTTQILDAFERCVVQYGLEGTSLEQIAEEAGVKRSILRHYVGNREQIEIAMATRFVDRYRADLEAMAIYLKDQPACIDPLLDLMLPRPTAAAQSNVVVAEALIAAGATKPKLRVLMTDLVAETVVLVRDLLRLEYPKANARESWIVAYGVVGICYNDESLTALALPPKFRKAAKAAARALIGTLA